MVSDPRFSGRGGRIWTYDLRIMRNPYPGVTTCQLPRIFDTSTLFQQEKPGAKRKDNLHRFPSFTVVIPRLLGRSKRFDMRVLKGLDEKRALEWHGSSPSGSMQYYTIRLTTTWQDCSGLPTCQSVCRTSVAPSREMQIACDGIIGRQRRITKSTRAKLRLCQLCCFYKIRVMEGDDFERIVQRGSSCATKDDARSVRRKARTSNPGIRILGTYVNSRAKVLVKRMKCCQEHETAPSNVVNGHGCLYYAGLLPISGMNDLEIRCLDIARQWNYEKNGGLIPRDIRPRSNKKAWWKC